MVPANIACVVDILHILPRPFAFLLITINIIKETFIKLELFLRPLLLKFLVMTIQVLSHDRVLNGEILYVYLREIPNSFTD